MKHRMAIPFDEIEENMRNLNTRSTRYNRRDTFISELEADRRSAVVIIFVGVMAIFACCLALWALFGFRQAEASYGRIYVQGEMTREQMKALNVMPAKQEKRHVSK